MGAFPVGGKAAAFTAGFFLINFFFSHFYEISRPRSFLFLVRSLVGFLLLSLYYYPLSVALAGRSC